jgi:hypothetical protein
MYLMRVLLSFVPILMFWIVGTLYVRSLDKKESARRKASRP